MATGGGPNANNPIVEHTENCNKNENSSEKNNENTKDTDFTATIKNQNIYSRTYDAHTTDDSDTDSSFRHRKSLLKHHHPKKMFQNQNFNLHHRSQHWQQNKKNSSSIIAISDNIKQNKSDYDDQSTKKSCLVHRNSTTSDEDNTTQTTTTISLNTSMSKGSIFETINLNESQNSIQGILKQSSRDASLNSRNELENLIRRDQQSENSNNNQAKLPVINSLIIQWQQHQAQADLQATSQMLNNQVLSLSHNQSTGIQRKSRSAAFKSTISSNQQKNQESTLNNTSFVPITKMKTETLSSNLAYHPAKLNDLKRTTSSTNNTSRAFI